MKESEKKGKYLDLARKSKKLCNIKLTLMPILTGALDTVPDGLLKGVEDSEIRGRVETIQTSTPLKSARILSPGDLRKLTVSLTSEKTISQRWWENFSRSKIMIIVSWTREGFRHIDHKTRKLMTMHKTFTQEMEWNKKRRRKEFRQN